MGNCMAAPKINVPMQEKKTTAPSPVAEEIRGTSFSLRTTTSSRHSNSGVEINLGDVDEEGNGGAVSFRILVTRRELKQILNYKNHSNSNSSFSIEHFLNALKMSGRMVPEVRTASTAQKKVIFGGWRPALESIPEEH